MNSIFLTTPGRVGTHWLGYILRSLLGLEKEVQMEVDYEDEYDCTDYITQVIEFEKQRNNIIYIKHVPLGKLSRLKEAGIDIVVLVRDFRDMLLSTAFYNSAGTQEELKKRMKAFDVPAVEADFKRTLVNYLKSGPNQRFFNSYFENKDDVAHSLVRYEDILQIGFDTVKTLLRDLGKQVEDQEIQKVLDENSFENLKKRDEKHFRKGVVGDWRSHISEEENQEFCRNFGHWMSYFGYE